MSTVYISLTGDDTAGDGTETNPWATLAKAHTETVDDDTIVFGEGTWDLQTGELFTKARTYSGYGAILTKSGTRDEENLGSVNKTTKIEGFKWTGGFLPSKATNWLFNLSVGTGQVIFKSNNFSDIEFFSDNFDQGFFSLQSNDSSSIFFLGCIFNGIGTPDYDSGTFINARLASTTAKISFLGCTMYFNKVGDYSCEFYRSQPSTEFFNNILYSVSGHTQILLTNIDNADSDYNCYYGTFTGKPTLGANDIEVDPKLIDPGNDDFRLQTNSPCIGAGNPAV